MLKGLLLCFSVLFVQLGVLHYFDLRVLDAKREEASATPLLNEQDDKQDHAG